MNFVDLTQTLWDYWAEIGSVRVTVWYQPALGSIPPVWCLSRLRKCSQRGFRAGVGKDVMKLYIGNVPYTAMEGDLQDWMAGLGVTVDNISVVRDRFSGESRGFGFAEIDDNDLALEAIEKCNGKEFMGRRLVINEARPPSGNRGGGGGGGGGGYRGGGGGGGGRGGGGGGRGGRGGGRERDR
jgi:uncharacterized membrane protein YgcG